MRVEQRIGRIDRIGQEYDRVWIYELLLRDTIEDHDLPARWPTASTGLKRGRRPAADPGRGGRGHATLAMLPASEREAQLEQEIAALRERLQHREVESLNLDAYLHVEDYQPGPPSPVTLAQLEDLLTHAQATAICSSPTRRFPTPIC